MPGFALRHPFRELQVVVVTGDLNPDTEAQCRRLGVMRYFHKPISNRDLRQAVKEALEQRSRIKVFISSQMRDLASERQRVKRAIQELGEQYDPQLAEDWVARPEPPAEMWQRGIRECDVFVLILGRGLGKPFTRGGISPTEDEYNHAQWLGKPILVFEKGVPNHRRDPELAAFLTCLRDPRVGHVLRSFDNLDELRWEVQRAILDLSVSLDLHSGMVSEQLPPVKGQRPPSGIGIQRSSTILFLAANPSDTVRLRLDREIHEIGAALQSSRYRHRIDFEKELAVLRSDMDSYLMRYKPQFVHISGHGTKHGEILLDDEDGTSQPVSPEYLGKLFSILKDDILCVVINACYTEKVASAIADHVPCVIGMSDEVNDNSAIIFARAFYGALGNGKDVKTAFELGRLQAADRQANCTELIRLFVPNTDPSKVFLVEFVAN